MTLHVEYTTAESISKAIDISDSDVSRLLVYENGMKVKPLLKLSIHLTTGESIRKITHISYKEESE